MGLWSDNKGMSKKFKIGAMQLLIQADLLLQVLCAHNYSVSDPKYTKNSGSHDGHTCSPGPLGIATVSTKQPHGDHGQE